MLPISVLILVDPHLGRLDYDSLSDQARMEILVDGLTEPSKHRYQDEHGAYLDVCDWVWSIRVVTCDTNGVVTGVLFPYKWMSGSLNMAFIPPHVRSFIAWDSSLIGTVDTRLLPEDLQKIHIGFGFYGTFDMAYLPRKFISLEIFKNSFHGELNLSNLPLRMKLINANTNKFSGSVDLSNMPSTLEYLWIQENNLSGSLCLSSLPAALISLKLNNNAFSGGIEIVNIPVSLVLIDVATNDLRGRVILQDNVNGNKVTIRLWENRIDQVVTEEGKVHRFANRILKRQKKASGESA